nr:hypothetical protein [Mycolicibacterium vulneris]
MLPVGRFPATVGEIEARFVDGKSNRRAEVWSDWQKATTILRQHVEICAVWLSGSFFTSKDEPDDIDSVYWAEDVKLNTAALQPASAQVIGMFAQKDAVRNTVGLRVDTFVVPWNCCPDTSVATPVTWEYWRGRGHWDDFWSRIRTGPKGAPAVRTDALPRRGYLEVIVDGFK